MNRKLVIQAAIDLFGYSSTDFDGMCFAEIDEYLLQGQKHEIEEYIGFYPFFGEL